MSNKTFTFDDTVISTIAKTLQLALLTGTDVVDNLRQIEVQENRNGTLSITLITIAVRTLGGENS